MNVQEGQNSAFPDFSKFGMGPQNGGRFIDVTAGGVDQDGYVKGLFYEYPTGRIGALMISRMEPLDDFESRALNVLIERCGQGSWAIEGLKRSTPPRHLCGHAGAGCDCGR